MKFPKIITLFCLALVITLAYSCKDDDNPDTGGPSIEDCSTERSYAGDIVPILEKSCAIENCHVNGFINGDYTSYADLKAQHDDNKLKSRIENGTMPPSYSAGPKELTEAEKITFLCWIEDGALDN